VLDREITNGRVEMIEAITKRRLCISRIQRSEEQTECLCLDFGSDFVGSHLFVHRRVEQIASVNES
jgi:hypothetical protein